MNTSSMRLRAPGRARAARRSGRARGRGRRRACSRPRSAPSRRRCAARSTPRSGPRARSRSTASARRRRSGVSRRTAGRPARRCRSVSASVTRVCGSSERVERDLADAARVDEPVGLAHVSHHEVRRLRPAERARGRARARRRCVGREAAVPERLHQRLGLGRVLLGGRQLDRRGGSSRRRRSGSSRRRARRRARTARAAPRRPPRAAAERCGSVPASAYVCQRSGALPADARATAARGRRGRARAPGRRPAGPPSTRPTRRSRSARATWK